MPSPRRIADDKAREARARLVFNLSVGDDKTDEEIAEMLKIEVWQVKQDIKRAYKLQAPQLTADNERAVHRQILRLRALQEILAPRAAIGNIDSIKEIRELLRDERKLLGLDRQKERIELSGPAGAPIKVQAVSDEIVKRFEARQKLLENKKDVK